MKRSAVTIALCATMLTPCAASAGPDAEALAHCLVSNTSENDRIALVKWMFSAMAQHPAVGSIAQVDEGTRASTLLGMAEVMTQLLVVQCADEARTAVRNEGPIAMQTSFARLGQVAATELFSSSEVARSLAELDSFLDHQTINDALELRP